MNCIPDGGWRDLVEERVGVAQLGDAGEATGDTPPYGRPLETDAALLINASPNELCDNPFVVTQAFS
jgi:hypothetical protein